MKAVILGAGFAGRSHAAALRAAGVEIAAVITSRDETARAFAAQWNIPAHGTDIALALAADVDVVHICTPPTTHGPLIRQLLAAGKHVVCEKPLSLDVEEAAELAKLAAESGRLCAVCFNSRFHLACQKARQLIETGSFGRPLLIHGNYLQEFHALPSPKDWRYNEAVAGRMRAVTEIGSHWLDLAQYISGLRAQAVSATFGRFWPRRSLQDGIMYPEGQPGQPMEVVSEDAAAVTLRFEGGALGSMLLSEASPGRGNHLALEITCENGSLWWNAEDNNRLYTARKGEGVHCEVFAFGNGFDDTFAMLFRSFYDAVEGKAPAGPWATFDQGAYITAACQAMAASADADSRWVEIKGADKL